MKNNQAFNFLVSYLLAQKIIQQSKIKNLLSGVSKTFY
jgi:hypothetical protein